MLARGSGEAEVVIESVEGDCNSALRKPKRKLGVLLQEKDLFSQKGAAGGIGTCCLSVVRGRHL